MRLTFSLVMLVAVLLLSSTLAWAGPIQCGDTLGPGGTFTLQADLLCQDDLPVAVTLTDGATLDLNGLTVSGGVVTVSLEGFGTTLRHGTLFSSDTIPLSVAGLGGHLVEDLHLIGHVFTSQVLSDGNVVRRVTIPFARNAGMDVEGDGNWLHALTIRGTDTGMMIRGAFNLITRNVVGESYLGYQVDGHANRLLENRATAITDVGYIVNGTGNWLVRNTAADAGLDAADTHGDCTHNRWIGNTFTTAAPACILAPFGRAIDALVQAE